MDPLWIAALCCFAASADQYRLGLRAAADGVGVAAATRPVEKPSLLPYLALVAGYVVVGRAALDLPLYPLGGLLLANVLVTATVVMRQMLAVSEHARLADRYHVAVTTDGLTGLLTRRHFLDLAADTMSLCLRAGRPVALLVIDVDRFKHVDDRHGHLAGDAVLAHVAQRCRGCCGTPTCSAASAATSSSPCSRARTPRTRSRAASGSSGRSASSRWSSTAGRCT